MAEMETGIRGDLEWGSIPGLARSAAERFGDAEAVVDGDVRLTFRELADAAADAGPRLRGRRRRAGRPRGHLVAQRVGVDRRPARPAVGRRRGRADQHPLQGRRGGLHPPGQPGAPARHRQRLPRQRLRRHARGPRPARTSRAPWCCAATPRRAPCAWADFVAAGSVDRRRRRRRPRRGPRRRRPVRHPVHVGHHREPEGRRRHPRPDAARLRRLGRHRRASARTTATSWSTRSSTPSATRPASSPASRSAPRSCPQAVFDIPMAMANVAEHAITALPGPPAIYQTFLNHPDLDRDAMQSLRLAVTGAAPVPVELIKRMEDELGFETVVTAYGLTECCGIVTVCRPDDPPELHLRQLRARHPRRRGAHRRRRRRRAWRAASRARSSCGATT